MSSFSDFLRSLSPTSLPTSTILPDRRLRIAETELFDCGSSEQCFGRKRNHRKLRRQELTDSQHLCRSTSKHNDSVPAEEPRRVRTNSPCPRRLSLGAETSAADATAWPQSSRFAQRRGLSPPMRRNGCMFPLLLHAPGHPAQKLPRQKNTYALSTSRRGRPTGACSSSAGRAFQPDAGERSTRPRCYSRRCSSFPLFRRRSGICDRAYRTA